MNKYSSDMKKQINDLLLKMQTGENCIGETANELLNLFSLSDMFTLEEVVKYTNWRDNAPYQFNGESWVYYDKDNTITESEILNYWISNYR